MSQSTVIEVKYNKWFVVFEWKDSVYVCQILKVTAAPDLILDRGVAKVCQSLKLYGKMTRRRYKFIVCRPTERQRKLVRILRSRYRRFLVTGWIRLCTRHTNPRLPYIIPSSLIARTNLVKSISSLHSVVGNAYPNTNRAETYFDR